MIYVYHTFLFVRNAITFPLYCRSLSNKRILPNSKFLPYFVFPLVLHFLYSILDSDKVWPNQTKSGIPGDTPRIK